MTFTLLVRPARVLLSIMACALLWAAALPSAHAAANFIPGAACQPMLNSDGRYQVTQTQSGVQNRGAEGFLIVCPVVRPNGPGGIKVYVDGWAAAGTTMTCVLSSTTYNGSSSTLRSFSFVGANLPTGSQFSKLLTMNEDEADDVSYQTLMCGLPANSKGLIRGILVKT
jgi:hypothetical protein